MSVNDEDLDLLDTYLDDELGEADVLVLRDRLGTESELSAALTRLRTARQTRKTVFASVEPDEAGVERILQNVKTQARKQQTRARFNTYYRYIGAAAACIVIGFMTGWVGRTTTNPSIGIDNSTDLISPIPVVGSSRPPTLAPNGGIGGIPSTPGGGAFSVAVTDESGRVIAVQRFNTLAEARQFAEDMNTWQARSRPAREGVIIPGSAEKF